MDKSLFGIENFDVFAVAGILIIFAFMEIVFGYLGRTKRNTSDWIQEFGSFVLLSAFTKPFVIFLVFFAAAFLFPDIQYVFGEWSIWVLLPLFLFVDDFLQYWYHRSAHEYNFLWKLHRPHHQAEEMGFFISYRNAALYYLMMPNIWWVGSLTFLGGAKAVAIGLILKQLVIIASHSTIHWDAFLYKHKIFNPFISILERIFITPAFHHAHHGKSMIDGISAPNGNYGNMFSIWDQLFGTAKYTRKFPSELGLMNDPKEKWAASIFYPLVTSSNLDSEISKNYIVERTATNEPLTMALEKDKKYLWCRCGNSKNQPFCDGSHHGTKFKPLLFEAKRSTNARLCNCKITKTGPFCDGSHVNIISDE